MSIDSKLEIISTSSSKTEQIANSIGKKLKGKEVIVLSSDLGGGKTVFVKGLANGAGSLDTVSSPTFTISKIYKCPNFSICHFDFYRLDEPGIISLELQESVRDDKSVVVIEWADIVKDILPTAYLLIEFKHLEQNKRLINIKYPNKFNYLVEGIK